jgi:hypothetical protein
MAGPLDIARQQKEKDFTPEMADVLRKWLDPSSLELVKGTPINCLVVSWASGLPADAEQQQAIKPLLEKGRQAGLDFVGLVDGSADKAAAVAAARSAGLTAVAMEAAPPGNTGIPVIPLGKSGEALWGANSPALGVSDGSWPGITQENDPSGGPTNLPWVNSNGALIAMARALAPNKAVWMVVDPPQALRPTAEHYLLAVADAEAYGGRWLVSLDAQMRAGLAAKTAQPVETWKRITAMLAFFEQNKSIRTYERMGRLAVMSNFSDPSDRVLGEQSLNLLPRAREPFRVIARSQALAASFDGLQAIFYVDQELPEAKLRQKLVAFAEAGGTLFVRAKWPNPEGSPIELSSAETYLLFNERSLGKGRLAVAKTDELDPFFTCTDIQSIMSHRGDPIRLYNGSSMNCFCQTSAQDRKGVIHVLNYSRRAGGDAPLVYMKTPYKSARFVSPEVASPVALEWTPQQAGGAELSLPRISVYGAVQMENLGS